MQKTYTDFLCNICGKENFSIPTEIVTDREQPSCKYCMSNLRTRGLNLALSRVLFGKDITLPEFPINKKISGLGLSDSENYAKMLKEKFDYKNTFYHTNPKLDITKYKHFVWSKKFDFLISSEIFEHIPLNSLNAGFKNMKKLLKNNKYMIFSVPYKKFGKTEEHFPNLYNFKIVETNNKKFLLNITKENKYEIYDNLTFHGGEGQTLEFRIYSESDLISILKKNGFDQIIIDSDCKDFGIIYTYDWSRIIIAK